MKTLKLLSLFILCIALIMGCAKDEELIENQDDLMLKKASKAPTFVVEPTGIDDTENLKNAFADAMAAGPGSVVQLAEAEYFIDVIEVLEFHGTLKGAGKGKTIITTNGDLSVDNFFNVNQVPMLIQFVGGDVCIKNLSIKTPDEPLSTGFKPWIQGQLGICPITADYTAVNEYIKAKVENVEFVTQGWVRNGILAESNFWKVASQSKPLGDIDISIVNCSFSGPYGWGYGALLQDIRKGEVIVGIKGKGNVFDNCDLGIWHNVSVRASVYGNKFYGQERWFPLQIINGPWWTQMRLEQIFQTVCNVEQNTFHVSYSTGAALINDVRRIQFEGEVPMLLQMKSNKFHTSHNMTAVGALHQSGAVIRNNKFTGDAEFGVRLFSARDWLFSDNGLMLGNNFSNADYSVATVLLGFNTRNWTVVGGNVGENIIDEGENNIITGFNNNTSDVPVGQTISDNLNEIKSPMHNLKGK